MNLVEQIKNIIPTIVLVLFLLIGIAVFKGVTSYFDPFNFCSISIDGDIIRGNEKTIKQAIVYLKETDLLTYETLCNEVRVIKEKYCMETDLPLRISEKPGCYIRGSRVIYVKPQKETTDNIVQKRVDVIKKYALRSEAFWQTQ